MFLLYSMENLVEILKREIQRQVEIKLSEYKLVKESNKQEIGKIITESELCKRLNISRQTISKYRKENKIPYLKIGDNIRYELEKVVKAISN